MKTQVEDVIMLINFQPSYWYLFSISTEFFCIEVSTLKGKCGECCANHDHSISEEWNLGSCTVLLCLPSLAATSSGLLFFFSRLALGKFTFSDFADPAPL